MGGIRAYRDDRTRRFETPESGRPADIGGARPPVTSVATQVEGPSRYGPRLTAKAIYRTSLLAHTSLCWLGVVAAKAKLGGTMVASILFY
jgi:hypothetical protein